jgi:hypothetical protein
MSDYIDTEDEEGLNGLFEGIESDDTEYEENEERRRRRTPPLKTKVPTGSGLYKARPTGNYVTQVQLNAALTRVGGQIKTAADATKAVTARVNTLGSRVDSETAARKKETTALRKDLSSGRMMSILPLLLTKPPALTSIKFEGEAATKKVESAEYGAADILPIALMLMMGGMGGGGDSKGGDDSMMMMLPLILIMSQPTKK